MRRLLRWGGPRCAALSTRSGARATRAGLGLAGHPVGLCRAARAHVGRVVVCELNVRQTSLGSKGVRLSSSTLLLCNWRWQVKVRSRVEAVGKDGHFSDAVVEFALDKSRRKRRGESGLLRFGRRQACFGVRVTSMGGRFSFLLGGFGPVPLRGTAGALMGVLR